MQEVLLTQFIPTYPRFKPAGILAALLFPQHQHSIDGKGGNCSMLLTYDEDGADSTKH